jgi:hypothetical protein
VLLLLLLALRKMLRKWFVRFVDLVNWLVASWRHCGGYSGQWIRVLIQCRRCTVAGMCMRSPSGEWLRASWEERLWCLHN